MARRANPSANFRPPKVKRQLQPSEFDATFHIRSQPVAWLYPLTMPPRIARASCLRSPAAYCTRWSSSLHRTELHKDFKILHHHHLIGDHVDGIASYDEANALQEQLRARFLAWKSQPEPTIPTDDCPQPHLISFESTPTFTLGRRQDDLSPEQTARLRRDLQVDLPHRHQPLRDRRYTPDVRKTNRGGLTTYHGPGQIVFWPVLDMHSPLYTKYGVASYAAHLEATTQRLLAQVFGIRTYTSRDEPGVWVAADGQQERKIAALGVHHRRHVTALGIALNIDIPVVGSEHVNPWARFVPCGLEGRLVTSVAAEAAEPPQTWDIPGLAKRWARMFEEGILDASKRTFNGTDDARPR